MRFLLVAGNTVGLCFPLVPTAWALRAAGHEVLVTAPANMADPVAGAGLPFAPTSGPVEMGEVMMTDRAGRPIVLPEAETEILGNIGRGFGRLAGRTVDGLVDLVGRWRPDLIVGATHGYAAALAAGVRAVPYVRHSVDMGNPPLLDDAGAVEVAPEIDRFGLAGLPEPVLVLDTCPPSVRRPELASARGLRYTPYNTAAELPGWALTLSGRPRVLLTLGSRVLHRAGGLPTLGTMARRLAALDVDVAVAVPPAAVDRLGELPRGVHAGWLPLDAVARHCDLVVHHAGGNTVLTCLAAGVPQVLVPYMAAQRDMSRRLAAVGAAEVLDVAAAGPEEVARAAARVLADRTAAQRSAGLAREIAAQPSCADTVATLESAAVG